MTNKIDPRMTKTRAALLLRHPFWGALALYLKIEEDPKVETMWTNGESLKYNPAFLDSLSELEQEGVMAHEVSHIAYGHTTRRGNREPKLWNEACDYAINRDLLRAGFTLPKDAPQDSRFDNMSAEQIFMVIEKEKQEDQKRGPGKPSQEPGSSPQAGNDPGGCGEVADAAGLGQEAQKARAEQEWRVRVMQAMATEGGKHQGQLPAHIKRMFESIRTPPVDWRAILRRFIDEKNRVDYSWSRPNKRLLGRGFVIPGMIPDGVNQIGIIVDTSGSIDKRALSRFVNELQAAVDDGITRKVTVVCCDTAVKARYDFEEGQMIDFKPEGGGGTKFSPAINWFAKNEPDVAALIYFTDLDCTDFGEESWVPMLWLAYGPANKIKERAAKVPFGEVLPLVE